MENPRADRSRSPTPRRGPPQPPSDEEEGCSDWSDGGDLDFFLAHLTHKELAKQLRAAQADTAAAREEAAAARAEQKTAAEQAETARQTAAQTHAEALAAALAHAEQTRAEALTRLQTERDAALVTNSREAADRLADAGADCDQARARRETGAGFL